MTNNNREYDMGKVIFDTSTKQYYCGLNKFSPQLRYAKVYHSDKYLVDAVENLIEDHKVTANNIEIRTLEMHITDVCKYL